MKTKELSEKRMPIGISVDLVSQAAKAGYPDMDLFIRDLLKRLENSYTQEAYKALQAEVGRLNLFIESKGLTAEAGLYAQTDQHS